MFKFETVVQASLCTALVVAGLSVFGQGASPGAAAPPPGYGYGYPPPNMSNPADCDKAFAPELADIRKRLVDLSGDATKKAMLEAQKRDVERQITDCRTETRKSGSRRSCDDPEGDYDKALREFISACGAHPRGGEADNIGCGFAIEKCFCTTGTNSSPMCSARSSAASRSTKGINVALLKENMDMCPALAAKGIDKLKKEVEDQRKTVRDMRNKLEEKQRSVQDNEDKADEKLSQLRDQMGQEAEKHAQKLESINDEFEKSQEGMKSELVQLRKQHTELMAQEAAIKGRKGQIDLEYYKTLAGIRAGCRQRADGVVAKLQEQENAKIMLRIKNEGPFNSFLQYATKPDRTRWQEILFREYNNCKKDPMTRDEEARALEARGKQLEAEEENENILEKKHKDINAEMDLIRKGACGSTNQIARNGLSQSSRACVAANKAKRQSDINDRLFRQRMKNLERNMNEATQKRMMAKLRGMDGQRGLMDMDGDLADEQGRLNELEQLLQAQQSRAGNQTMDEAAFNNSLAKYDVFKAEASKLVSCGMRAGAEHGSCGDKCQRAARYLYAVGDSSADINRARAIGGGRSTPGRTGDGVHHNDDDAEAND